MAEADLAGGTAAVAAPHHAVTVEAVGVLHVAGGPRAVLGPPWSDGGHPSLGVVLSFSAGTQRPSWPACAKPKTCCRPDSL